MGIAVEEIKRAAPFRMYIPIQFWEKRFSTRKIIVQVN